MNHHVDIDTAAMQHIGDVAHRVIDRLAGERVWDGKTITEPGVYRTVPIDTYHRDTTLFDGFSISSSGLRAVLRRPSEYWWSSPYNLEGDQAASKPALEFGKAAHMLLLGEEGFSARYALKPSTYVDDKGVEKPWSGNANACKAWLKDAADAGRFVITETDLEHIRQMTHALSCKETVRLGILNGRIERSIFHEDKGIWLKTRPDVVPADSGDFVDLKTAASVDDDSLARSIYQNGYHVQAGLLRLIVREVLGAEAFHSFTFVFVEKTPPYDVRVMALKDADIDLGERQALHGLRIVRECLKRQEWPGFDGFDQHISFTEIPTWARTRIETELKSKAA